MKTIADRYTLTTPVARGGMGIVWQATDLRLNRQVAVKLIDENDLADRNDATRRFYREARITARLRHPGVPVVYDFGSDGGELFMVMEYVEGHMVADLIAEHHPLPVPWTALIAAQVCAVLTAAHEAELIHRDIKPDNLVMCPNATVKVIDFGVATSFGASEFSQITQAGQIPGSARYTAPELFDGAQASRSTDLYTIGCLLYELLAGVRPYASKDLMTEINRSRFEDPPAIGRDDVPRDMGGLTLRLLDKSADRRPSSAIEVFDVLKTFVRQPPPIPGLVDRDLSNDPVHMYAAVIQHVSK
ncbi:serine/threonine-protein kinase [Nonomuraea sp. NPDC050680]|uniref:serine/threonine-protein kinase n=1 Tax=Nonomuraea sp. NPDC050680 TaxID=3154630 RepID=UPI0033D10DC3